MGSEPNYWLPIVSGLSMVFVAVGAPLCWRTASHADWRWFWIGVGLWAPAVLMKLVIGLLINAAVIDWLKSNLPFASFLACGGLFVGLESSLCEIGLTLAAVWVWRTLGREAGRAIAIGVGAGAFEAFLLGTVVIAVSAVAMNGLPGTEEIGQELAKTQAITPLGWLIGPVERLLALLCHASSRALVLLGVTRSRWRLIFGGFVIFTIVDGTAGAALASGKIGDVLRVVDRAGSRSTCAG
jgi:hypothetical protein